MLPRLILGTQFRKFSCRIHDQFQSFAYPILGYYHYYFHFGRLQGSLNVLADHGSRMGPISTEWSLDMTSFLNAARQVSIFPQVDLFATRYNFKISTFVSPCPDDKAWAMDATTLDWNQWDSIYLFPPSPLLVHLLPKIASFKGVGLLIANRVPGSVITTALDLRCRRYFRLPFPVLTQETKEGMVAHGQNGRLQLFAWFL